MDIYLDRQGKRMGPYSVDDINKYLGTGQVLITDMAWYGGLDAWVSLDKVPGVQNVSPPQSTHPLWNSPSGAPPAPVASPPPAEKKSSGILKGCLIAAGVVVGLVIVGVGSCAILFGTAAKQIAEEEEAETKRAKASPISNLKWEEIDKIYVQKNDYTKLQMKELWKKYYGKKVKWSGNVSSISDSFGTLSLQVKINPHSFSSDVFVKLKDNEREKAIVLKEGDPVIFMGILDDYNTILRHITLARGEIVQ